MTRWPSHGVSPMSKSWARWPIAAAMLVFAFSAAAQPAPSGTAADATLRSTPETVIWGYFAADAPPVLRIRSGQTVRIDTVSHSGMNTPDDPVTFFGRGGIPPDQVLQDVIDIHRQAPHPKGASAHVLTGPIFVEGAAPGDMLEVRIIALEHRVPYGVNNSNHGTGLLPDLLPRPAAKIIKLDLARNVALFSDQLEVPLHPFMGIMAVAPPRHLGLVRSRPPSPLRRHMH